jgi:uncharacterized protein (TIGR02147 family)
MQEFYEERKRCSAFSWREFSHLAGFSSSNYMKLVCDGKTRLSKVGVERVAKAMELEGSAKEYFAQMVVFADSGDEAKKNAALKRIRELAKENKVRTLSADAYAYFSEWYNPVLRELAPMNPGAKPMELSKLCYPEISATEIRKTLDFLIQMGLLKKHDEYHYEQTEKVVMGVAGMVPPAMRPMHRQMAKLAMDAIDNVPVEDRSFAGATMGISRDTYRRIACEAEKFRQKVVAIASEDKHGEQVYRLNLQLFPLTRRQEENHE